MRTTLLEVLWGLENGWELEVSEDRVDDEALLEGTLRSADWAAEPVHEIADRLTRLAPPRPRSDEELFAVAAPASGLVEDPA